MHAKSVLNLHFSMYGFGNALFVAEAFYPSVLVITIIYFYRREQLKRITEDMDKSKIANLDVFYSYLVTFTFVALVVLSVIFVNK